MMKRLYVCLLSGLCAGAVFAQQDSLTESFTHLPGPQEAPRDPWTEIFVDGAFLVNPSYSNKPYKDREQEVGHGSNGDSYFRPGKESLKPGFSLGISLVHGRSPYVKKLLTLRYTLSQAEFGRMASAIDREKSNPYSGRYSTSSSLNYRNTSHVVSLIAGMRFRICKGFYLDPCLGFHGNTWSTNRINGTIVQENGPDPKTYHSVTDSVSHYKGFGVTLALMPKATYEFAIAEQKLGVYAACNFAIKYRLPWYMLGVSWYPFRNLRAAL